MCVWVCVCVCVCVCVWVCGHAPVHLCFECLHSERFLLENIRSFAFSIASFSAYRSLLEHRDVGRLSDDLMVVALHWNG